MVRWNIATDDDTTCNIYKEWRLDQANDPQGGAFYFVGYEGIPQNLVLNLICSFGLVILFSFSRKVLWNYGRVAVMQRNEPRYTEIYNGPHHSSGFGIIKDPLDWKYAPGQSRPVECDDPKYRDECLGDDGAFDWIWITYSLTSDQIRYRCGPDAVHYLSYQRHLLFLASIMCVCSMMVILPIHIQGRNLRRNREYTMTAFEETTIANVRPESPVIWIHVTVALFYLVISIFVMRHFSRELRSSEEDDLRRRSILLVGINRRMCHIEKVQSHFEQVYPSCTVEEVSFIYDTHKLSRYEDSKFTELSSIKKFQEHYEERGERYMIHGYCCGKFCCLLCKQRTDAIRHYASRIRALRRYIDFERARTLATPLGSAFVTFTSIETAQKILNDYNFFIRYFTTTPHSHFARKMSTHRWIALAAPAPSDIYWENFGLTLVGWFLKFVVVNFTVIIVVLIFSTPIIFIKSLETIFRFKERSKNLVRKAFGWDIQALFHDTLPTLIIWIAAVTLPSLVTFSDRCIGYWTRTAENRSRMIKTFTFLLLMIIILPSLGISSFLYFVDQGSHRLKIECIFAPSNGAFYINYVATSCFIGVAADLNRFPELFSMLCRLSVAKSKVDIVAVRVFCLWDYQMGTQYAWTMIVFAVFTIFSITCPLITPFGVFYLLVRNFVDKYNIFFAYAPCKVDKAVHLTAINFVVLCMFLLQFIILAFTNKVTDRERHKEPNSIIFPDHSLNEPLEVFVYIVFCVAIVVFLSQIFFSKCSAWTPDLHQVIVDEPSNPVWVKYPTVESGIRLAEYYNDPWAPSYPERHDEEFPYRIPTVLKQNTRRFFSCIPRSVVTPIGRYFAPILRKDFPADFPGRTEPLPSYHSLDSIKGVNLADLRRRIRPKDLPPTPEETEEEEVVPAEGPTQDETTYITIRSKDNEPKKEGDQSGGSKV